MKLHFIKIWREWILFRIGICVWDPEAMLSRQCFMSPKHVLGWVMLPQTLHESLCLPNIHLKALVFLYAFEESVDCHLLSSFCDYSNLHISLFKHVLSTMGVSKESISKFLIGNRFDVKLRILNPENCKQSLRVKSWKAEVTAEKKQTQDYNQNFVTQAQNHNILTNWLTSRMLVATKKTVTHEISVYSKIKKTFTQINKWLKYLTSWC